MIGTEPPSEVRDSKGQSRFRGFDAKLMDMPNKNLSSLNPTLDNRDFMSKLVDFVIQRKKWLIIGGIATFLIVIVLVLSMANFALSNPFLDGQQETAKVGSLIIPVTATGSVQSAGLITIKSKAGGIIQRIPVIEGQMVKVGDVLAQLDPVDEKRNVAARQDDLDRATSLFEQAKIRLENQQRDLPLQTIRAESQVTDGEAKLKLADFQWKKMQDYSKNNIAGEVEVVQSESAYLTAKAALDIAKAALQQAKNNQDILVRSAKQDVIQSDATRSAAQKALDEAKLRLDETIVKAKSPGMVYSIFIKEGEAIQSGTQSFTGGTPLMTLADVSSMFVMSQIDEADIGAIRDIAPEYARPGYSAKLDDESYAQKAKEILESKLNKTVEITVEAYRSTDYKGVIELIRPEPVRVNNALAFNVKVRLVGNDLQKLDGLQADLSFTTDKIDNVVLVKNEALVSEGRECFVYIPWRPSNRGRWDEKKIPVKIGKTDGTYTEIVSGLKDGDAVWVKRPMKTEKEKKLADQG
jgi:multidrug efflux pump subunit AcrA (membrane-fusion protein)